MFSLIKQLVYALVRISRQRDGAQQAPTIYAGGLGPFKYQPGAPET